MILKSISLSSFRNIKGERIEFSPGVNILFGKNAQGKTNALEGIYMFSRGRSFRTAKESDLLEFGADGFRLEIEYSDSLGDNTLSYAAYGRERRIVKNGYRIKKISEMIGNFRSVLFSPDDLSLVKGGPEERRAFLNIAISQKDPSYIKYYSAYKSAMEQKNILLKNQKQGFFVEEEEISSWSRSMAEYASYIYLMRREYIKEISAFAKEFMKEISSEKERIEISYKSDIEKEIFDREKIAEEYLRVMKEGYPRECGAGVSLFGIHHDDMEIKINEKNARLFSSQGQKRSIVLALKLAEGEVIKREFGEYPVYLLDDVLSELDGVRREYFLSRKGEKQIIITSCDEGDDISFADRIIRVEGGSFSQEK